MKTVTINQNGIGSALLLATFLLPASLANGQTIAELGDAGDMPVSAQDESTEAITLITGSLATNADIDVYKITIDSPSLFSATTAGPTGTGVADDTRLFLIDASGYPVYWNDDLPDGSALRSILPAGHALSPSTAGDYYLAVTGYPQYPSDGTLNIFGEPDLDPALDFTDIIGANTATSNPMTGWDGGLGEIGTYEIAVSGVSGTLPVELVSFDVRIDDDAAIVAWSTASEVDNAGFGVEMRGDRELDFIGAGFVAAAGRASDYSYRVDDLEPGEYSFRLRQVDTDGSASYSPVVQAMVGLNDVYRLSDAFPNPFGGRTTVALTVRESQHVVVSVFDLMGRRVVTLVDAAIEASSPRELVLDGSGLPSGSYVVVARGERFSASQMVTLAR